MNRFRRFFGEAWRQVPSALGIASLLVSVPLTMNAVAQTGSRPVPARVIGTVSETQRTTLQGSAPIAAMAQKDFGALPDDTPLKRMIMVLQPSAEQEKALQELLRAQVDPTSPQYHHWLTPTEFGAQFGVAAEDIQSVTQWLQMHGFSVDEVPAGRRSIVFSGTAGQLRDAFSTELHRYQIGDDIQVANSKTPEVPAALSPVISNLLSLNNIPRKAAHHDLGLFSLDRQHGSVTPVAASPLMVQESQAEGKGSVAPQFTTTIGSTTYRVVSPYDFATIYDLKPLWNQGIDGTGQTIAIVSRSDLNLSDVDKFRANFGLPATKVNKIYANENPGITSDVAETALDVEWSGAVAKNATIDLVIGGSTLTSDGVDISALYIVNNNLAPVVSMSYGQCELSLGSAGNTFYNTLWQQAAAQGQTVFVSSGDAGATTCNQGGSYSTLGLSVNGLASTPYNVSVGGTDLYGSYSAPATYWSTTNDPATLSSALSYVPEIPWNDSCGNPIILNALKAKSGYTDASTAQLCNNSKVTSSNYRNVVGGGGGASNCTATTDGTIATCKGGYTKPSWQNAPGVPSTNARFVPDVSLFSGDGLWSSFYPYCVSSLTQGGVCDLTVSTNIQGAGGTSFASPAFAGIMALINQKTASVQGNANPIFYKLASSQSSLDCTVESSSSTSACIYHDVDLGGNATPCYNYGGAKDCTVSTTGNIWGVVSGYAAGKGYDPAIGLGSVDITNLVNAWPTASASLATTATTLTLSSVTAAYGNGPTATVTVTSASGTPTGNFSILATGQSGRQDSDSPGTLSSGKGTLALSQLPVGTYPVTAHYAGDGTYGSSDSAPQNITVTKAATTLTVSPSRTTLTYNQSSQLTLTLSATGAGDAPTGTITILNTSTGAALGTATLASNTLAMARAVFTVSGQQLQAGANVLTLAYSGDSNYATSTATQSLTFTAPFTASLSANNLTVTTGTSTSSASTTLTVAASGMSLAYPISLSCNGSLPTGASCSLSNSVLSSPATSSTVTVSFNPSLAANNPVSIPSRGQTPMIALAGVALLCLLGAKHNRRLSKAGIFAILLILPLWTISGCGGDATAKSNLSLSSSASSSTLGNSITLKATLAGTDGGRPILGSVTFNDSFRGVTRNLGNVSVASTGDASLTTTTLGLGTHSITAVYAGDGLYPATSSSAVPVNVTSSATLQVAATDANGYTVAIPMGVTLQ